ncbi:hypothetical protein SAMN05216266_1188 [Amycolatopsis marina]|uniref:Uncharacterized protein n=1 Tax=Amycolatopsis marina TaxID=490629 RepID=A0A1I1C077_9PSEU|nr:hypothetical protein [Amycolatopsis marina]SFB54318.1 hypothetical protein SAMN05216266_1188 [Amycolatopsis marina]
MRIRHTGRRTSTLIAASAVAVLPFTVAACDIDGNAVSGGYQSDQIAVDSEYFADDKFVGETVNLDTTVTEVLTARSFVIDGGSWGDDSVLLLFVRDVDDVEEGAGVRVMGTVQRFSYAAYADQYELADAEKYEPYADEQFVVATTIASKGHGGET